jgi:hypothetical protein
MSTMDRAACHVIYVNRNASEDGLIYSTSGDSTSDWATDEARHVVQPLLDAFGDGSFFRYGVAMSHFPTH